MGVVIKFLSRNEAKIVFLMVATSFAFGFCGYWMMYIQPGTMDGDWNSWDVLYSTLMLYILEAGADGGSSQWPWMVQLARFLAPISVGWAAVRAVMALLDDELAVLGRWRLRQHIVIFGCSTIGAQLAREYASDNLKVVWVQVSGTGLVELQKSRGITRLFSNGDCKEDFKNARVAYARHVFAVHDDEQENARTGRALAYYLKGRSDKRRPKHPVLCHLAMGAEGGGVLHQVGAASALSKKGVIETHLFDPMRIAVRSLIKCHPPVFRKLELNATPHVLVIGFGRLGQQIVKQVIRVSHYPDHQRVKITVVSDTNQQTINRFRSRLPMLDDIADIRFSCSDPASLKRKDWDTLQSERTFDMAFIEDADINSAIAIDARDGLGNSTAPSKVILCSSKDGHLIDEIGIELKKLGAEWEEENQLVVFNMSEEVWTKEYLVEEKGEKVAKDIHARYLDSQRHKPNFGKKLSHRPWNDLPEYLRDANRDQADHISLKVQMFHDAQVNVDEILRVGRTLEEALSRLEQDLDNQDISIDERMNRLKAHREEGLDSFCQGHSIPLEVFAEVEHRRWMASAAMAGFRLGTPRSERKYHHPDMIPYEALEEQVKEWDRNVIREFPLTLVCAQNGEASAT